MWYLKYCKYEIPSQKLDLASQVIFTTEEL